ncbi:MAG: hypothetical protein COZ11_03940, partial [Deltaproteobacteria bacterium CG_4_10_14_3_um_filter_51_14]
LPLAVQPKQTARFAQDAKTAKMCSTTASPARPQGLVCSDSALFSESEQPNKHPPSRPSRLCGSNK